MTAPALTRRGLLKAASAGAALSAFGGVAWAEAAAARGRVLPLSVGYLEGSDLLSTLRRPPWRREDAGELTVVPAEQMPLGDQSLALSTVEMRVHGLYPRLPPRRRAPFSAVVLTVWFPSFDPLHPEPFAFYSWQGKVWPGPSRGAPVTFLVPLADDGLELTLEVFTGTPAGFGQGTGGRLRAKLQEAADWTPPALTSLYAHFTVDWHQGRPKLQRGLYLLGLEPGLWRFPWSLPEAAEARERPPDERLSVVVGFDAVPEDDPRLAIR